MLTAYLHGLNGVWAMLTAICGIALLSSFLITPRSLERARKGDPKLGLQIRTESQERVLKYLSEPKTPTALGLPMSPSQAEWNWQPAVSPTLSPLGLEQRKRQGTVLQ